MTSRTVPACGRRSVDSASTTTRSPTSNVMVLLLCGPTAEATPQAAGSKARAGRSTSRYTLGLKLFALGNAVARRFDDIRGLAAPAMHELQDATEQTVYLAVRRGDEAVCIERLEGTFVQLLILP